MSNFHSMLDLLDIQNLMQLTAFLDWGNLHDLHDLHDLHNNNNNISGLHIIKNHKFPIMGLNYLYFSHYQFKNQLDGPDPTDGRTDPPTNFLDDLGHSEHHIYYGVETVSIRRSN